MANAKFRLCELCGKEFVLCGRERRFCSWECYTEQKKPKSIICDHCGKSFIPNQKKLGEKKFCSRACQVRSVRVDPHTCVTCGTIFTPVKYRESTGKYTAYSGRHNCSRVCASAWKSKASKIIMLANRDRFIGKNNHMWIGACLRKNKSYRGPDWSIIAEKARNRDKYQCKSCGMSQIAHIEKWGHVLEVHHKIPFYQFTNHKKANSQSNLITLCKACHCEADRAIKQKKLLLPIHDECNKKRKEGLGVGSRNSNSKLTDDDVREIRRLIKEGVPYKVLAEKYGVLTTQISNIKLRLQWKHI